MNIMTFAQVVDTTISHHSHFLLGLPTHLDDPNLQTYNILLRLKSQVYLRY